MCPVFPHNGDKGNKGFRKPTYAPGTLLDTFLTWSKSQVVSHRDGIQTQVGLTPEPFLRYLISY